MVVAAAVGGVATAGIGAASSSIASSKAAKTAKNTAAANNALQTSIYNQNSAALSPYERSGNQASDQLSRLLGLGGMDSNNTTPGYSAKDEQAAAINDFTSGAPYQAEQAAGLKSVQAALGAKGLLDSGAALKSLDSYGDQFLSGKLDTYEGQLAALSGQGLTAASAQAGVGQGYANSVSANNNTAAEASENADLSSASSFVSVLSSLTTGAALYGGLQSSYGKAALGGSNKAYGIFGPDGIY